MVPAPEKPEKPDTRLDGGDIEKLELVDYNAAQVYLYKFKDSTARAAIPTTTQKSNWDTAYSNSHTHSNKTALDTITSTKISNWDSAATNSHTHSNKTILDGISSANVTAWNGAYTKPTTGIPKTDLASAIQTSLGLADTAVQDSSYVHTDNNFTSTLKSKLDGIAAGAEVNVQADWNQTSTTADDYIKNKPTIPTAGTGLTLSGSAFNHSNSVTAGTIGSSSASSGSTTIAIPYANYDAQGHITSKGTHTHTISSYPEANLTWGGKNFSASYGPIDAAMIDVLGANRFAFLKAEGLTIEYSTDNGTNWSDYEATDLQKVGLFSSGQSFYLGKHTTTGSCTVNDLLRVTVSTSPARLYTSLNKIAIYMSTSGSTVDVKIEKALESTPTSFSTHLDWTPISGWSGWNILNISSITTYGNSAASQYGRIRFIFRATKVNTNYTAASISKIMGFGGVGWTTPSNMAATGHLYSYDSSQNATFPAKVTATSFSGDLSKAKIQIPGNQYYESGSNYAMNFANSDIIGLNGVYFSDSSDGAGEGINFYRGTSAWDSFRARNGLLEFSPNRSSGNAGTWYTIYHTGNNPSYNDLTDKPNITTLAETAELSDAIPSTNYQTVSQAEKDSWNAKSTFSGNYSDLNGKPTIPTTLAQLATDTTHRVVTDAQINQWNSNYTLPSTGIPLNDLSQPVRDLLTNKTSLFESDIIIGDVYFKRYAAGRLMVSEVE